MPTPSRCARKVAGSCNALDLTWRPSVRRVLDAAGMTWAIPHTFRRTVASLLEAAGWALSDIADVLGHADPAMTMRNYLGRDAQAVYRPDAASHL